MSPSSNPASEAGESGAIAVTVAPLGTFRIDTPSIHRFSLTGGLNRGSCASAGEPATATNKAASAPRAIIPVFMMMFLFLQSVNWWVTVFGPCLCCLSAQRPVTPIHRLKDYSDVGLLDVLDAEPLELVCDHIAVERGETVAL